MRKTFLYSRFKVHSSKRTALNSAIRWDSNGLVCCVIQDEQDGTVLMVAYMNRSSLEKTLKDGLCCFWSRSRKELWLKGKESGNFQIVKKITIDCDGDCLLIKVKQVGDAACHTGMRSCFYREVNKNGEMVIKGKKIFDPEKVYGKKS